MISSGIAMEDGSTVRQALELEAQEAYQFNQLAQVDDQTDRNK